MKLRKQKSKGPLSGLPCHHQLAGCVDRGREVHGFTIRQQAYAAGILDLPQHV
jgi:hypothetical protein